MVFSLLAFLLSLYRSNHGCLEFSARWFQHLYHGDISFCWVFCSCKYLCVCMCLCTGIGMHMYVWGWYVCVCGNTCMLRPQEDTRYRSLSSTTLIFRERPLMGCACRPMVFWGCRQAHGDAWLCMCILGTGIQVFVLGWHLLLTTETSLLTLVLNLHTSSGGPNIWIF